MPLKEAKKKSYNIKYCNENKENIVEIRKTYNYEEEVEKS